MKEIHNFKVVILGDEKTGKSAVLEKLINNSFSEDYKPELNAENYTKLIDISGDCQVSLQVWAIGTYERMESLGDIFFQEIDCCVFLYDITNFQSFSSLDFWRHRFLRRISYDENANLPFVLIGNKLDKAQIERKVTLEDSKNWCENKENIKSFEVSAKNGSHIWNVFEHIAKAALNEVREFSLIKVSIQNLSKEICELHSSSSDSRRANKIESRDPNPYYKGFDSKSTEGFEKLISPQKISEGKHGTAGLIQIGNYKFCRVHIFKEFVEGARKECEMLIELQSYPALPIIFDKVVDENGLWILFENLAPQRKIQTSIKTLLETIISFMTILNKMIKYGYSFKNPTPKSFIYNECGDLKFFAETGEGDSGSIIASVLYSGQLFDINDFYPAESLDQEYFDWEVHMQSCVYSMGLTILHYMDEEVTKKICDALKKKDQETFKNLYEGFSKKEGNQLLLKLIPYLLEPCYQKRPWPDLIKLSATQILRISKWESLYLKLKRRVKNVGFDVEFFSKGKAPIFISHDSLKETLNEENNEALIFNLNQQIPPKLLLKTRLKHWILNHEATKRPDIRFFELINNCAEAEIKYTNKAVELKDALKGKFIEDIQKTLLIKWPSDLLEQIDEKYLSLEIRLKNETQVEPLRCLLELIFELEGLNLDMRFCDFNDDTLNKLFEDLPFIVKLKQIKLDLSSNKLGDKTCKFLAELLEKAKALEHCELDLSKNSDLKGIDELFSWLEGAEKLSYISLKLNKVTLSLEEGKKAGEFIGKCRKALKSLHIDLSDLGLKGGACLELFSNLGNLEQLGFLKLNLENNKLEKSGFIKFNQEIQKLKNLYCLDINLCKTFIDKEIACGLFNSLREFNQLRDLFINISEQIVGDEGIETLFKNLKGKIKLSSLALNLSKSGSTGVGIDNIDFESLPLLRCLVINLSFNQVNWASLMKLLIKIGKIELNKLHLNFSNNSITFLECEENKIINKIQYSDNLVDLCIDLSENLLINNAIQIVGSWVREYNNLSNMEILLSKNKISPNGAFMIGAQICSLRNLTSLVLKLSHNEIGDAGVTSLVHFLSKVKPPNSFGIDLSSNDVSEEGMKILSNFIFSMENVSSLSIGTRNNPGSFLNENSLENFRSLNLACLDIQISCQNNKIVNELTKVLKSSNRLETLSIRFYDLNPVSGGSVLDHLDSLEDLIHLTIEFNDFKPPALESFIKSEVRNLLSRLKKIRKVQIAFSPQIRVSSKLEIDKIEMLKNELIKLISLKELNISVPPLFIPVKGINKNGSMKDMISENWKLLLNQKYSIPLTFDHVIKLKENLDKNGLICMGAINIKENDDIIKLYAITSVSSFFTETFSTEKAVLSNESYWYFVKGKSIGFCNEEKICLNSADTTSGEKRISWHLNSNGGWRVGDITNLSTSEDWMKVILFHE